MLSVFGMPIISSIHACTTENKLVKMCRSKKCRIVKKWLKNPKNYKTIFIPQMYKIDMGLTSYGTGKGKVLVAHPEIIEKLKLQEEFRDQAL